MFYVFLQVRQEGGRGLCSYFILTQQVSPTGGELKAGPFATMAQADAWIASTGHPRGTEWVCV